jgi:hypothetical protein
MKRLLLAVLSLVAAGPWLSGALAPAHSSPAGGVGLTINGAPCAITSWSGGDLRGTVVTEPLGPDQIGHKHIGELAYDPIVVEAGLPLPPPLVQLLAGLCSHHATPSTLVLTRYDFNHAPVGSSLQANNTLLSTVMFPALDAASREPLRLTFVFYPESVQEVAAPAAAASSPGSGPATFASAFSVQIDGLETSAVSRIEPFALGATLAVDETGIFRENTSHPSKFEVPNLVLTLAANHANGWVPWRDDFLLAGNNGQAREKSGRLILGSGSQALSLHLSQVGLVAFAPTALAEGEAVPKFRAEIYLEAVSLDASAPASSTASSSPAPASGPAATPLREQASPLTPAAVATPRAALAAGNPEDKGAHDLADFPRPPDSVRKSYVSIKNSGTDMEIAAYVSTQSIRQLDAFYTQFAKSHAWEETTRMEGENDADRSPQILIMARKGEEMATLAITRGEEGKSEVQIQLIHHAGN